MSYLNQAIGIPAVGYYFYSKLYGRGNDLPLGLPSLMSGVQIMKM